MAQQTLIAATGGYYFSPVHFVATYSSEDTLTISALPSELTSLAVEQFVDVLVFDADSNLSRQYINGQSKFEWTNNGDGTGTLRVVNAAFTATCSYRVGVITGMPGSGGSSPPTTIIPPEHPTYYRASESGAADAAEFDYYVDTDQVVTAAVVEVDVTAGSAEFTITRSLLSGDVASIDYSDFGHTTTPAPATFVYDVTSFGPTRALKVHVKSTSAGTDFAVVVRGA